MDTITDIYDSLRQRLISLPPTLWCFQHFVAESACAHNTAILM